ncbi:MAG TPA: hypothetical protein PKV27_00955, partial [Ilumatobacteraceae bacterium]|nr:hypothetical protein [Ilumatobacteraceae bacterium]
TGNVGRQAGIAIAKHPRLKLIGAYAHSAAKAGQDAGSLLGRQPIGAPTTNDIAQVIAWQPDCVMYTPLYFDVDQVVALLSAGINVVTTSEFVNGRSLADDGRQRIEQAAAEGGATIFGSGANPGFAQLLAATCTQVCSEFTSLRVSESVDVSAYAGDANMNQIGWGRPAGDPDHPADLAQASRVFADGVEMIGDLFGVTFDDIRPQIAFSHATRDLDLPGRPMETGSVAGIDLRWQGLIGDRVAVEIRQVWAMGADLDPPLKPEHGYVVEVDGTPRIRTKLEVYPPRNGPAIKDMAYYQSLGMIITAMPAVNAIEQVCAAPPGVATYATLRPMTGRLVDDRVTAQ